MHEIMPRNALGNYPIQTKQLFFLFSCLMFIQKSN